MRNSCINLPTPSRLAEGENVDVTPVMNMFIILIPFLVSMAVFSHLSVLEFSLPADGGTGRISDIEELPVTVALTTGAIAVTRGEFILATIDRTDGRYDFERLVAQLRPLAGGAEETGETGQVIIAIDDGVLFADIVDCMDHCRSAGFAEVGLAAGTNLDRGDETGEANEAGAATDAAANTRPLNREGAN